VVKNDPRQSRKAIELILKLLGLLSAILHILHVQVAWWDWVVVIEKLGHLAVWAGWL
jgi:hypothetical protein